jgi:hypothetical protein
VQKHQITIDAVVHCVDVWLDVGLDADSDIDSDAGSDAGIEDLSPRLVRGTIDFSAYKEFKLRPMEYIELPETEPNGSCNWSSFRTYEGMNNDDWRFREGGVLYALAEYGDFFNCISVYHSHQRTGIQGWNALFEKLQNSGYCKNIVPCMVGVSDLS